jgi:hypothetical protein
VNVGSATTAKVFVTVMVTLVWSPPASSKSSNELASVQSVVVEAGHAELRRC